MKIFIYSVIVIVIVTVIAGFFIVGSPQEERLRRFDQQRVNHLNLIQGEVINYWLNKGKLPAKLSELEDNIRGFRVPTNPENSGEYIYQVKSPLSFSLCANFARPSLESEMMTMGKPRPVESFGGFYGNATWQHDAGLTCFERTIDKDFYKPVR